MISNPTPITTSAISITINNNNNDDKFEVALYLFLSPPKIMSGKREKLLSCKRKTRGGEVRTVRAGKQKREDSQEIHLSFD